MRAAWQVRSGAWAARVVPLWSFAGELGEGFGMGLVDGADGAGVCALVLDELGKHRSYGS